MAASAPHPYVSPAGAAYTNLDWYKNLSDADKASFDQAQYLQQQGMGAGSLKDFQTLLGRLEASKIRQQQAKDVSARPNIYAQGLAQMMSNF